MSMTKPYFSNAFSVWEEWNLLSFDEKSEYLLSLESKLKGGFQDAFQYQMVCSKQTVGYVHNLPGLPGRQMNCIPQVEALRYWLLTLSTKIVRKRSALCLLRCWPRETVLLFAATTPLYLRLCRRH